MSTDDSARSPGTGDHATDGGAGPPGAGDDGLLASRARIDAVDRDLVRLLAERLRQTEAIGRIKASARCAVLLDRDRENALSLTWSELAAREDLPPELAQRILAEVLDHSRRRQERFVRDGGAPAPGTTVRVGYQGAPGAYSELAIERLFAGRGGARVETVGHATFSAAVDALARGDLEYVLLPVENSITGGIPEVSALLCEDGLAVVDEEVLAIRHCLVGLPGSSLGTLRRVRSHPVALQQCARTLKALPGVEPEPWFDTAGAAESLLADRDPSIGALASEAAAVRLGLAVLRRDVADHEDNRTRFLLLAREPEPTGTAVPAKTSLLIAVDHRKGALARCLATLCDHGVNLTRLESRPQPGRSWEYRFFVDFEGHPDEPRIDAALRALRQHVNHMRLLGTYPNRTAEAALAPLAALRDAARPPVPARPRTESGTPPLAALPPSGARTIVRVGDVEVGGARFTLILGPCAVESREQIHAAAAMVRARGAHLLRGGAFKPRSSPYSFQGLGAAGVELLAEAGRAHGLPVVTEVMQPEQVELVARHADVLQIGARNMQNFPLLERVGAVDRPVLLKRGLSATLSELLFAAEYVLAQGNQRVILCERGIRTFETATRHTLDLGAVPALRALTHLPILVDPSHAAGRRDLVVPLALAAAAAGADGLIVECHPDPERALCDKEQALGADDLDELCLKLAPIVAALGRRL